MKKTLFILPLALTLSSSAPLAAQTDVPKVARLGMLSDYEKFGPPASPPDWLDSFRAGLHELGYAEGSTFLLEFRYAKVDPEQEVRQVERELTEALGRGDLRAVERIYADDYTLTGADGEFRDKPQRLAALKLSDPKAASRNRDDIKVRVYGDTAVVTGRTLFKELVKGVERTEGRRFTHVFVKRQGQWQMVASQVTPVTSGQRSGFFAFWRPL